MILVFFSVAMGIYNLPVEFERSNLYVRSALSLCQNPFFYRICSRWLRLSKGSRKRLA